MTISRIMLCLFLTLPAGMLGQNPTPAANANARPIRLKLPTRSLYPDLVDKSLNACDDFYKYSCNKWIAANPIPADQVYWSTGGGLESGTTTSCAKLWKLPVRTIPNAAPYSRRSAITGPPA